MKKLLCIIALLALCVYGEEADEGAESALIESIRGADSVFYQGVIDFSKDAERASGYLEKACKAQHPGACFYLGSYYEARAQDRKNAAQSKQNNDKAQEYYKQGYHNSFEACKQGAVEWCSLQAVAFIDGHGVPKDVQKGLEYLQMMCERDIDNACFLLGTYYFYGMNVEKNIQKSKEFTQKALELDTQACDDNRLYACVLSAEIYQQGLNTKQDLAKAKILYSRACDIGNQFACEYVRKLK